MAGRLMENWEIHAAVGTPVIPAGTQANSLGVMNEDEIRAVVDDQDLQNLVSKAHWDKPAALAQTIVTGAIRDVPIGSGHQGPIILTFQQPQRTERAAGFNPKTGEMAVRPATRIETHAPVPFRRQDHSHTGLQSALPAWEYESTRNLTDVHGASVEFNPLDHEDADPVFSSQQVAGGGNFSTRLQGEMETKAVIAEALAEAKAARAAHTSLDESDVPFFSNADPRPKIHWP